MKRALKLKSIQLKQLLIISALIMLVIASLAVVLTFFVKDQNTAIAESIYKEGLIKWISGTMDIFLLAMCMLEGMSYFDASLHLGVPRRSFFTVGLLTLGIFTCISYFLSGISALSGEYSGLELLQAVFTHYFSWDQFLFNLFKVLGLLVVGYGYYRYGWKVLLVALFSSLVFSAVTGYVSFFIEDTTSIQFSNSLIKYQLLNSLIKYQLQIKLALIALEIGIYYMFVTRTEIQN